jgi:hypothetical protein
LICNRRDIGANHQGIQLICSNFFYLLIERLRKNHKCIRAISAENLQRAARSAQAVKDNLEFTPIQMGKCWYRRVGFRLRSKMGI